MALITLQDISLSFGGPLLFNGINVQIEAGERICLVGRNGEGKSTLMQVISGELTPDSGTVVRRQGLRSARLIQEVQPQGQLAKPGGLAVVNIDQPAVRPYVDRCGRARVP